MRRLVPIVLTFAATAGACKRGAEDQGSDAKIYGGEPVKPEDPVASFTGALMTADGAVICSATLVSPTVMVTAAHCLRDELVSPGMTVVFGTDVRKGTPVPVKAYAVHKRYNPANKGSETKSQYDLGLLALAGPIAGHTPIPLMDPGIPLEPYAATLKIAGYGFTDVGASDIGILRWASTNFSGDSPATKEVFIDGFRVANACAGDSGGPALIRYDNQNYLLGAASYVIAFNGRVCSSGFASYTDLRAYRSWIANMIQRLPQLSGKVPPEAAEAQATPQAPAPQAQGPQAAAPQINGEPTDSESVR